ncbi:DNA mismatch repair protein MutS [bacterium]|nr:DNA mismatch repair protein MutS [bacterium]
MRALLLHRERDFAPPERGRWDAPTLTQDLELEVLVRGMAGEDDFIADVARRALVAALASDVETILYRQAVLRDCLNHRPVVRQLYELVVEAIETERHRYWGIHSRHPASILHSSIELLELLLPALRRVRDLAAQQLDVVASEGLTRLFSTLVGELTDAYLDRVEAQMQALRFRHGTVLSAELGEGNRGTGYVVRAADGAPASWWSWLVGAARSPYTFHLDDRDEAGARALQELRGQGLNGVANALAQSADHVLGFFRLLRTELAFYIGCLNLHAQLTTLAAPVCFPIPEPPDAARHRATGLYDPCLALQMEQAVVGNALHADGRPLVIITGANQGGKSSFLRAVGVAQLMMQCGMFVAAESFAGALCPGLFTHYRREEDATMTSGKLDEELRRLSEIADRIAPGCILLCNETFAATNEREGSALARQVVEALLEKGIRVFFVTHLYELARQTLASDADRTLFLRDERRPDGTRSFCLIEAPPLDTGHGEDLYRRIFDQGAPAR